MPDKISPYLYPGLKHELLDGTKYPFVNKYRKIFTEREILDIILNNFDLTMEMVSSKIRTRKYVDARVVITYILRKKLGYTYTHIGKVIGNRDHTTVIHNERKFVDLYDTDTRFKDLSDTILKSVGLRPLS